jgi:hypothetical protein
MYCDGSSKVHAVPPGLAGAAQLRATVNATCGIIVFALNIIAQITISIEPGWPFFDSISPIGNRNLARQNYTKRDLLHFGAGFFLYSTFFSLARPDWGTF